MITLSTAARQKIESFFDGRERTAIRVYAKSACGKASRLALASGTATDGDSVYELDGLTFCLTKNLEKLTGDISIDLSDRDLVVSSSNSLPEEATFCDRG